MTTSPIQELADLRGHRSAPPLSEQQRLALQQELRQRLEACDWFTIGIMAPGGEVALACLRSVEQALGWPPLELSDNDDTRAISGPVFLKGHQRAGTAGLRSEAGLGEGVLLSGHSDTNPEGEDTWGPFPLDFFLPAPERGAAGL